MRGLFALCLVPAVFILPRPRGRFNRSSQHCNQGGVYGTTCRVVQKLTARETMRSLGEPPLPGPRVARCHWKRWRANAGFQTELRFSAPSKHGPASHRESCAAEHWVHVPHGAECTTAGKTLRVDQACCEAMALPSSGGVHHVPISAGRRMPCPRHGFGCPEMVLG